VTQDDVATSRSGSTTVGIVPHTHWDREWYAPFQTFRFRLVHLIDQLVDMLERDPSYARFLLDGQTAVLDDYLEIRPEAEARIRRLTSSGRLSIGPWTILMDEFMVSGETIVRDLQMGLERGASFGGAMQVGYLPDMFGHVAQMPQILRLAGLEHAVVWRGVPSAIDRNAFWWESPDGSRVRAEYLWGSYSNGRDIPDDAKQLALRARGYHQELGEAYLPGAGMLLMNGTDHQLPQPWLGRVVAEANDIQDEFRFAITSLPEYLDAQPTDGLPSWRGELRSGARANVLMGVASNRVDVHQACAAAERALERVAEPLAALVAGPERDHTPFLREAWERMVLNSAHDSSCACSHDEVVDQVLVRYHEARQIADAIARQCVSELALRVDAPAGASLVVNTTARDRRGIVAVKLPGDAPRHFVGPDGTPCPTQVVEELGGESDFARLTGSDAGWILDAMRGPEFMGTLVSRHDLVEGDDGRSIDVILYAARSGEDAIDLEELRQRLEGLAADGTSIRLKMVTLPQQEVLLATDPVPGFGWRTYTAVSGVSPSTAVRADGDELANEHLSVRVDTSDATYAITTPDGLTLGGLGRLVDGGDGGDTYNYSPPDDDLVVHGPESVHIQIEESGPVRARMSIEAHYRWPAYAIGGAARCTARSTETADVAVTTTLELRTDEPFLRVHTTLDNRARDHRLRAHFPLPGAVEGSHAECAFAVVERGLEAEGGPHEAGLPTFVSRRFVDASDGERGLALLHDGLLEYEVVDGRELALTLLRATGYLSRSEPALRPNLAGPLDPLEGPQLQRRLALDYAVLPHRGSWEDADLYAAADRFLVPLQRTRVAGFANPTVAPEGRTLAVDGAEVSAVLREPGGHVVRVFNPLSHPTTVSVRRERAPATGWIVDLRGAPVEPFEGHFELRAGGIATLTMRA